jgi:hypothetical protein
LNLRVGIEAHVGGVAPFIERSPPGVGAGVRQLARVRSRAPALTIV